MAKEKQGASLNPEDFSEGGLLDNVEALWKECKFVMWDYQGKVQNPVPAAEITMELEDGDEAKQYWSAGNPKDWVPNQDGSKLLAVGSATGINSTSNFGILMASLINAGFPGDRVADDITLFEGLKAHMVRQAAPKRTGLPARPRADGREFEQTILVVDKILKFPWDKKGTKKAAPKAAEPESGEEEEEETDLESKAIATIMGILGKHEEGVARAELGTLVFQELRKDDDRNEIVQLVYKDDFIKNGPWTYADGKVSMGG